MKFLSAFSNILSKLDILLFSPFSLACVQRHFHTHARCTLCSHDYMHVYVHIGTRNQMMAVSNLVMLQLSADEYMEL